MKKIKIYTDGGARGNPGPAGCGVVIEDSDGRVIKKVKQYLGEQTNNFAEYSGVLLGLKEAQKLGAEEVEFLADSELVVKQLNGEYRVKNEELGKLFIKIYNLSHNFKKVSFKYVPREMNGQADALANEAMDKQEGQE